MGKTPCDDEDRDGDTAAKTPNCQQARSCGGRGLGQLCGTLEGSSPANSLVSDFQPPEVGDNVFILFRTLSLQRHCGAPGSECVTVKNLVAFTYQSAFLTSLEAKATWGVHQPQLP